MRKFWQQEDNFKSHKCSLRRNLAFHLKADSHFAVIGRGTFGDWNNINHFEVDFRSMESLVDYFLFIEVASEKMPPILEKYGLV